MFRSEFFIPPPLGPDPESTLHCIILPASVQFQCSVGSVHHAIGGGCSTAKNPPHGSSSSRSPVSSSSTFRKLPWKNTPPWFAAAAGPATAQGASRRVPPCTSGTGASGTGGSASFSTALESLSDDPTPTGGGPSEAAGSALTDVKLAAASSSPSFALTSLIYDNSDNQPS